MSFSRLKIGLYAFLVSAVFVLASYRLLRRADSAVPGKDEVLIGTMLQGLSAAHYQPEKVDDAFSKRVFDLYLKRLDFRKKFLLASDVEQLRKFQTQIDDEVKRGSHEFLDLSTKLMAERTKEMQLLYRELLAKPFDFTTEETFQTDFEKAAFPADKAAQREQWRKLLKYETLSRISEMMDAQEKAKDKKALASTTTPAPGSAADVATPAAANPEAPTAPEPPRTPAQMEAEARKRVLKVYDDQFADLLDTDANERLSIYANTIANTYDPHTEYFAPREKQDFDIAMTGRFEGIGATLREKDGLIYVEDIIPGSASSRQGQLKKGDALLRVAQGAAEPVSIEGWRTQKAITLIRGKKGSEVRLTVKKPDGSTQIIPIIRDVVVIEETYAQSATIDMNGQKIGYLRLPTFYADFNDNGGRSSAEDVKKELAKLNAEGVKGVVFDLRYNGGGSLTDAVEMAGLFMESGPMVQVRDGQGRTSVLNDKDPRVQYSGPLVVLVNKYSASASEILAAAIQDYKRGVIMGSASTYGKGTVQRIFDLDEALPAELNSVKPIGSLKLTTQKFYRVNGGSTQFKGVMSDIVLPDAWAYLDQGEKETDYPLKWDEIQPARYRPWDAAPAIDKLRANSKVRVAASPSFKVLDEIAQRMKKRKDETTVSLKLTAYRTEQAQAKAESDKYEEAQKASTGLTFTPLSADVKALAGDTIKINRAARFTKNLKKDITIGEAVAVINDELK
ncbi:carboxy terminal-processing peptidase [Hymenobacter sp. ASUV-10]|uniref:Carboxy terminal-processing peptidase n=1 Tax=Hymenobacter aranciens TaxID=3063996 RepID=A0ABT9B8K8_9BACT|nr:carboxy terminal-processing peptidase [Hymenobacter sp. ASUV-10]MDO7874044.1 carboxy terminal-processing peptidase [Hymenobacter sp. ASUV-10]